MKSTEKVEVKSGVGVGVGSEIGIEVGLEMVKSFLNTSKSRSSLSTEVGLRIRYPGVGLQNTYDNSFVARKPSRAVTVVGLFSHWPVSARLFLFSTPDLLIFSQSVELLKGSPVVACNLLC